MLLRVKTDVAGYLNRRRPRSRVDEKRGVATTSSSEIKIYIFLARASRRLYERLVKYSHWKSTGTRLELFSNPCKTLLNHANTCNAPNEVASRLIFNGDVIFQMFISRFAFIGLVHCPVIFMRDEIRYRFRFRGFASRNSTFGVAFYVVLIDAEREKKEFFLHSTRFVRGCIRNEIGWTMMGCVCNFCASWRTKRAMGTRSVRTSALKINLNWISM